MQTLIQYLAARRKADFAKLINVSNSQLSQYLSGYRRPSFEKMIEIERATDGAVPVGSWADMPAAQSGDAA